MAPTMSSHARDGPTTQVRKPSVVCATGVAYSPLQSERGGLERDGVSLDLHGIGAWRPRGLWASAALWAAAALIALRASASVSPPASGILISDHQGAAAVASLPVGGPAWMAGVRPGMPYHPWPEGGGGYVDTGSMDVGVAERYGTWPWYGPVLATALFLGSAGLLWLSRTAGALGLVLTTAFVTNDLLGLVTAPVAWVAVIGPMFVFAMMWRSLGQAPRTLLAITATACGLLLVLGAAAPGAVSWSMWWWCVATTPALAAIAIVGARLGASTMLAVKARGYEQPLSTQLVRQTAAGRQAVMLAEESARDRYARWLHDHVMPALTQPNAGPAALAALAEDLRDHVDRDQLAILGWGGLQAALDSAASVALAGGLRWTLVIRDLGGAPPWDVQVAAWRVAQEAIRNAVQHSSAEAIVVGGEIGATRVTLRVADDGVGLDEKTQALARASGHIGVVSMVQRARDVGATLAILPNRPTGTIVELQWMR